MLCLFASANGTAQRRHGEAVILLFVACGTLWRLFGRERILSYHQRAIDAFLFPLLELDIPHLQLLLALASIPGTLELVHLNGPLDSLAISILPDALTEYSRSFPEMSFTVRTGQPFGISQHVAEGEADIGITFSNDPPPGVRVLTEKATPIGAMERPPSTSSMQGLKSLKSSTKLTPPTCRRMA